MTKIKELYISVDIEASGPIPGEYSLLAIGSCLVSNPSQNFYCEIKPITKNFDSNAMKISKLSLNKLKKDGLPPDIAMISFERWLLEKLSEDQTPCFVGFNAPFDWSFINYYFHRFMGRNPFGFSAIDIKSIYMGKKGCYWSETKSSKIDKHLHPTLSGNHNALQDAQYQAELFSLILPNL